MPPQSPTDEVGEWDRIRVPAGEGPPELPLDPLRDDPRPDRTDRDGDHRVPVLQLVAAAWGDLVAILAVCTTALAAAALAGHPVRVPALPWAAGLAGAWWLAAGAATVLVRHGTPGMLMAGVSFDGQVAPRRVPLVVLMAAIQLGLAGLPACLPIAPSLLARAGGRPLRISVP